MENTKLQEDLLKEFKEEKELINNQLNLLDPLAISLRKPIATRLLNSLLIVAFEAITWVLILATIAFAVVRDKVYPFYILNRVRTQGQELGFSDRDMNNLYHSVLVFALIIAILLFIIARNLAKLRKKNNILQMAGKTIKVVVGEHLHRRAAINTIEQRHFGIMDHEISNIETTTEAPNPAY